MCTIHAYTGAHSTDGPSGSALTEGTLRKGLLRLHSRAVTNRSLAFADAITNAAIDGGSAPIVHVATNARAACHLHRFGGAPAHIWRTAATTRVWQRATIAAHHGSTTAIGDAVAILAELRARFGCAAAYVGDGTAATFCGCSACPTIQNLAAAVLNVVAVFAEPRAGLGYAHRRCAFAGRAVWLVTGAGRGVAAVAAAASVGDLTALDASAG